MVEGDVFPATGSMTTRAIGPKLTVMCIVCSMAGKTTRRRASIHAIDMTGLAGDSRVLTRECETRPAVIEIHISPAARVMALSAVRPKLTFVQVVFLVAGKTIHWRATVAVRMAAFAFDICVLSGQLESSQGVIEGPILPGTGIMTGLALFAEATLMEIILLVAGKTLCRSSGKKQIGVATFAGCLHVRADQFEVCQVMVKLDRGPSLGEMAIVTLRS